MMSFEPFAEGWLIRDGSFLALLIVLSAFLWVLYRLFRLAVSRLLVSYHWAGTCIIAIGLMLVPALCLYLWEYSVETWLDPSGAALATQNSHILSVYFNSVYPGIPHLPLELETLKGRHIPLLAAGVIGYLLISGVLLSLFVNVLQNKVKNIEQGDEPCVPLKGHIVLIGRGSLVVAYLRYLQQKEAQEAAAMSCILRLLHRTCKIVLLTEDPVPSIRERLKRDMDERMMKRIIFMHGSRNSTAVLKELSLQKCREIVLLNDTARPDWDDINVETLSALSELLSPENPRPCTLYFERFAAYTLFLELYARCYGHLKRGELIRVERPYREDLMLPGLIMELKCPYKNWADEVLLASRHHLPTLAEKQISYRPMDYCPITYHSENTVHLVIIGMSRMGMGLAIEAANLLHFPNFVRNKNLKTRITLIDAAAEREMSHWRLSAREYFRALDYTCSRMNEDGSLQRTETHVGWLDTEFHFIQASVESESLQKLMQQIAQEDQTLLTVAVCLQNARQSLSIGLNLPAAFYTPRTIIPEPGRPAVQAAPNILIHQDVSKGVLSLLRDNSRGKYAFVRPFGMMDSPSALAVEADDAPMVAAAMHVTVGKSGDFVSNVAELYQKQVHCLWASAPHWLRLSNRYFAAICRTKIRSLGVTDTDILFREETKEEDKQRVADKLEEVRSALSSSVDKELDMATVMGQVEHYRWLAEKFLLGYAPLTAEERRRVQEDEAKKKEERQGIRNQLKAEMKHADIVPYEQLPDSSRFYCELVSRRLDCLLPPVISQIQKLAARKMRH